MVMSAPLHDVVVGLQPVTRNPPCAVLRAAFAIWSTTCGLSAPAKFTYPCSITWTDANRNLEKADSSRLCVGRRCWACTALPYRKAMNMMSR